MALFLPVHKPVPLPALVCLTGEVSNTKETYGCCGECYTEEKCHLLSLPSVNARHVAELVMCHGYHSLGHVRLASEGHVIAF